MYVIHFLSEFRPIFTIIGTYILCVQLRHTFLCLLNAHVIVLISLHWKTCFVLKTGFVRCFIFNLPYCNNGNLQSNHLHASGGRDPPTHGYTDRKFCPFTSKYQEGLFSSGADVHFSVKD